MSALCLCGCGKEIMVQRHHSKYGAPKYINSHNNKRSQKIVLDFSKEVSK